MKWNTLRWLPLAAFVLFLVACAGGQPGSSTKPEPVKYTVEMTEFAFQPAELQAKVGQEVTIELANKGALEHEFMVGRDVKITNSRPDGYEHDLFAEAQKHNDMLVKRQDTLAKAWGDFTKANPPADKDAFTKAWMAARKAAVEIETSTPGIVNATLPGTGQTAAPSAVPLTPLGAAARLHRWPRPRSSSSTMTPGS